MLHPGRQLTEHPPGAGSSDTPVSRAERRRARSRRLPQLIGACVHSDWPAPRRGRRVRALPGPCAPARQSTTQRGQEATTTTSTVTAATSMCDRDRRPLRRATVAAYVAGKTQDVTAAVYDDVTGRTSLYRPGTAQATASIMKVDILATLLAQAQADGQSLSLADQALTQTMIENSDNDSAQDLWDDEGGATAVQQFDTAAGLTQTTPDAAGYWGLSTTTAADQVQLLRTVAYANASLHPRHRHTNWASCRTSKSDQAWGVSAGPGTDASVALKNGWLPLDAGGWQVNSIGYVTA